MMILVTKSPLSLWNTVGHSRANSARAQDKEEMKKATMNPPVALRNRPRGGGRLVRGTFEQTKPYC